MLTDVTSVLIGGETVKVRRLSLGEIKKDRELVAVGDASVIDEARQKLIAEHVTMADGSPLKVEELSLPQMQTLMKTLVGLPDGGGLTDFIGLLC